MMQTMVTFCWFREIPRFGRVPYGTDPSPKKERYVLNQGKNE